MAYQLIHDGGRRGPAMNINYWALHMGDAYGLNARAAREETPREDSIVGYAGFQIFAFLRGEFIDVYSENKYNIALDRKISWGLISFDGAMNSYGIDSEEHQQAIINLMLNAFKLRMMTVHWLVERKAAEGKLPFADFSARNQNQVAYMRDLTRMLPDAEEQLASLNYFYGIWEDAMYRIYSGSLETPERLSGNGDGLRATYFDTPHFTLPLATETVPQVWYGQNATMGVGTPRAGVILLALASAIMSITVKGYIALTPK